MTQALTKALPSVSQATPQGLLVPSQNSSKFLRLRMNAEQGAGEVEVLAAAA